MNLAHGNNKIIGETHCLIKNQRYCSSYHLSTNIPSTDIQWAEGLRDELKVVLKV